MFCVVVGATVKDSTWGPPGPGGVGLGSGALAVRVGVLVGDGLIAGGGVELGVAVAVDASAGEGVAVTTVVATVDASGGVDVAVVVDTSAGEGVTVSTAVAGVDASGEVGVVLGAAVGRFACDGDAVEVTAATTSVDVGGRLGGSNSGVEAPHRASNRIPSMARMNPRNSVTWCFVMFPSPDLRQSVLSSASVPPNFKTARQTKNVTVAM
jgi:hypothetical protein